MSEHKVVILDPFSEAYGKQGTLVGDKIFVEINPGEKLTLEADPDTYHSLES